MLYDHIKIAQKNFWKMKIGCKKDQAGSNFRKIENGRQLDQVELSKD